MTRRPWRHYLRSIYWDSIPVSIFLMPPYDISNTIFAVPSSTQLLVLSPFTPKYTIHNDFLNISTTVTVEGFDARSVKQTIPKNAAAYVKSITINGQPAASRCHIDFYDVFKTGGNVTIEVTADKDSVDDCSGSLPESLSTGGFATVR